MEAYSSIWDGTDEAYLRGESGPFPAPGGWSSWVWHPGDADGLRADWTRELTPAEVRWRRSRKTMTGARLRAHPTLSSGLYCVYGLGQTFAARLMAVA